MCFSLPALLLLASIASPCPHVLPDGATPCVAAAAASSSVGAASASAERQPLPRCSRHGFRGAATSSTQTLRHSAPASNIFPMALRCSALASNKPHPAEKRTPVWLAIWRIWAGFANSQLRRAAFRCTYSYICTQPRYCRLEPLLRQTQIFRPICTDCLRHLRISAE